MGYTFTDPVQYYLVRDRKIGSLEADFKKIIDYLLTYVGEVGIKKLAEGLVEISYDQTPLIATLKTKSDPKTTDTVVSRQITLTCEKEDNISVNLIKNVTKNIGYRIFNPQTKSYLVLNPNLLDLTTIRVKKNILNIIKKYDLTPLFQFQNALVFYAKDNKGKIHLINRHLLEFLTENSTTRAPKKEFSTVVADDIGRFVALFDRGLIPINFYDFANNTPKTINQSGFNLEKLNQDVIIDPIYLQFNVEKQTFTQFGTQSFDQRIKVVKGKSAIREIAKVLAEKKQKYLAIKFALDISYLPVKSKIIPKINVSVYLDSA